MTASNSFKINTTTLLVPITVMAFTMALFFMFQTAQVMRDRDSLNRSFGGQEEAFVQSQKLSQQFGGLVMGTQKLAKEGNVTAVDLEKRLKQIGIIQDPAASQAQQPAPVPAAMEKKSNGPVKP